MIPRVCVLLSTIQQVGYSYTYTSCYNHDLSLKISSYLPGVFCPTPPKLSGLQEPQQNIAKFILKFCVVIASGFIPLDGMAESSAHLRAADILTFYLLFCGHIWKALARTKRHRYVKCNVSAYHPSVT